MKTFVGVLKKGKLDISGVPEYLKTLPDGVVLMRVELIEEIVKHRKQYFAIIDEVVNYSGYDKQEIHLLLKKEILLKYFNTDTTKTLTIENWSNYIEYCRKYIFETLDIYV